MLRAGAGWRPVAAVLCGLFALALASESWAQMEEITVTTRKREENLQVVPVAISTLNAEQVERLGVTDVGDLSKLTSSLIFDTGFAPQDTRITIRGLAPVRGRQNAAVLQDGVDISSQAIATGGGSLLINPRLFDIERVEIVKGPQNALYGRSAFNGAINYIMRQPGEEFEGRLNSDIGNNGQAEIRGSLSGPLVGSTLLGSASVAAWSHDGFYRNSVTGAEVGGENGYAVSGSLVWKATDKLNVRLRAEILDDEFESFPFQQLLGTTVLPIPAAAITAPAPGVLPVLSPAATSITAFVGKLPDGDDVTLALSEDPRTGADYPGTEREVKRATLTADYDFGATTLTYLGHLANSKSAEFFDGVRIGSVSVEAVGSEYIFNDDTDLQSHELRLTSNGDNRVNWVFGGLFWNEEKDFLDGSYNCLNNSLPPLPYPPCAEVMAAVGTPESPLSPDFWGRETSHWSVFGLVDWEFIDGFNLILEGRYTDEDEDYEGPIRLGLAGSRIIAEQVNPFFFIYPPVNPPASGQNSFSSDDSYFLPKATLQWQPSDTMMYYLSWAEAAKPEGIAQILGGAGGFNDRESFEFKREEMTAYELGAKTQWLDNRLLVNGAVFFQDYTDKQVSVQVVDPQSNLIVPRTANTPAEVYGLELDLALQATDQLQLRASYTYLSTEYTNFLEATSGAGNIAQAQLVRPDNCRVIVDPGTDRSFCEVNLTGNELEYAPEHAFVGGFTLTNNLANGLEWFLEGDAIYQDERFVDRFNVVYLDAFTTFDFRVGLRAGKWDVIAYVENAFDDDTIKNSTAAVNTRDALFLSPFGLPPSPPPSTIILPPSQMVILPDQRQFGVRTSFRFGGSP